MANWSTLKAAIANAIKTNGNKEITGQLLQNVLTNVVTSVGENATFAGIARPTTNPGLPDGPVFYLACKKGTYSNFNGQVLSANTLGILYNQDNTWLLATIVANDISVNDTTTGDLEISDENGNSILRIKDGHIQTKNFDSEAAQLSVNDTTTGDLEISDENGNSILRIKDGHIQTKNFDSETGQLSTSILTQIY